MQDPLIIFTLAAFGLAGLTIVANTALRGWNGWLELKREELARRPAESAPPSAATRIEVADLAKARGVLQASGVAFSERQGAVAVPPDAAHGLAIAFVARQ